LPSKTIDFSESLQGKWKLRTYAGRADGILSPEIDVKGYWSAEDCKERMCNLGEGQLLVISGNECRLHFTDTPFTATHFAINYAEEVYHTDRKKIVCFKNNKDNLFLTVIDNTTQEVEWRGSYWSETSYMFLENYRHDETSDLYGQWILGDLFACMKYWYDLYDKNRSPIYSKTPIKIDSKGYLPEHVGDWAGYVDGWGAEQLPGVLATERKYRAGFDSGDQSLRTITGLYAAQMPELYPPVAALKSSNAIEDPTAIGPAIAAIQQSQAGVVK
ncbi:MAG: hypothetical protein O3C60_20035, partial [Planctomycetota bacterium]|nr:hypothetical protein [Planctomycetota bacterium]